MTLDIYVIDRMIILILDFFVFTHFVCRSSSMFIELLDDREVDRDISRCSIYSFLACHCRWCFQFYNSFSNILNYAKRYMSSKVLILSSNCYTCCLQTRSRSSSIICVCYKMFIKISNYRSTLFNHPLCSLNKQILA